MFDSLELPQVDPTTPVDQVIGMLTADGMPFATKTEDVKGVEQTVFANQPATLKDVFMLFLAHADKEYMVYQGERITFAETLAKASQLSQALVDDFGVKRVTVLRSRCGIILNGQLLTWQLPRLAVSRS